MTAFTVYKPEICLAAGTAVRAAVIEHGSALSDDQNEETQRMV